MNRFYILLSAFIFTLLSGLSATLTADDTEIYLRQVPNLTESKGRPNILFILDRSSSMKWKDRDEDGNLLFEGTDRLTRLKDAMLQMLTEIQNVNVGFMGFSGYAGSAIGDVSGGNAAVLFPITYIDEEAKNVPGELDDSARLNIPILDYADDAEEGNETGKVYLDDKTLEMVYSGDTQASLAASATTNYDNIFMEYKEGDNAGTIDRSTFRFYLGSNIAKNPPVPVINGLRFVDVGIPQGATIKNASVSFVPNSDVNGTISSRNHDLKLKIRAVLQNDAINLAGDDSYSISKNWSDQTTEEISWDPGNWSEFVEYNTPDLSSLVQQVVDRSLWKSGNALGIVFETDGEYSSARLFDHKRETPVLNVSYTLEGGGTIINSSVSYSNDNGFECIGGASWNEGKVFNDEQLFLGYSGFKLAQTTVGLRFRNLLIPPKAIIKSAKIEMTRLEGSGNTTDLKVLLYAEDADDTVEFVEGRDTFDLSQRPKTSNKISWDVPNVGQGRPLSTPDMTNIVQEIVDREGWLPGNSMAFFMKHVEGEKTGRRRIATFSGDGSLSRGATLTILYEEAEEEGEDAAEERISELQKVGLRFQNVGIPQGARITEARIDFVSGFAATDEAVIDINGEDVGNSEAFSNSAPISERTRTSSKVRWEAEPWEWTDGSYSSPEVTNIVQEIVNKSDWCGNNALSFILTAPSGSPLRNAVAYDADPEKAPVLKVTYDITSVKDNACMRYLFTKQVIDANDDVEETNGDGIVYTDSRTLDMTTKSGNGRIVGLRFQDIPMSSDTEVLSAKLIFSALGDVTTGSSDAAALSRSAALTIYGEATGDSEPFDTTNRNVSSRAKTRSVTWSIDAADKWQTGRRYSSVDVGPVIQDIIGQSGWKAGNALSLFITGSGLRQAASFERALTDAPMLQVEVRGSLSQSASTVRERMKLMIENIEVDSTTPLVDTIYEAASYLEGKKVTFGKDRKYTRTKRVSHRGSWKDGELFRPEGCTSSDPWAVECQGEKITGNAVYVPPEFDQCQKTYIVFLTDGGATANSSYKLVPQMTGKACKTHGSNGEPYEYVRLQQNGQKASSSNIDELCGVDVVEYMHEKDYDSSLEGKQNVIVHTVGFNLGPYYSVNGTVKPFETQLNERAVPYLRDWAKAGGGNFYEASSSAELTAIFRTIVSSAMTESTSFAAPSLSVNTFNRMLHRNEVYFSLFKPGHTQRWDGNIKKYTICDGTTNCENGDILDSKNQSIVAGKYISDSANSYWNSDADGSDVLKGGAGERLLKAYRKIYTYVGDATPGSNHNIDLTETPVSGEIVTKELLGDEYMNDDQYEQVLDWINGLDVTNDYDDEAPFGKKRWLLTDLLHSSPVTVTYGGTEKKPLSKLFVGTNDGLIRMFDTDDGDEEWAFLPQEMLTIQEALMTNAKGARIYGIDGTPSFRIKDTNNDGKVNGEDYVQMFIGMRRGGRNLYALDVTSYKNPKLMWVIKGGIEGDPYQFLGQTWSRPKLARIYYRGNPKTVIVFGGGYHGDDESNTGGMGNGIYIVDPDTGSLLWRAGNDDGADLFLKEMKYPIPSDVALIDSNADGVTDRLYVGDIGGQVWRVDLPLQFGASSDGIGGRLAMISDLEDKNPQVINRRRFFYPPEVVRLSDLTYSDTTDYFIVTITSGSRPSPLNIETHDRFYAFRDRAVNELIGNENGEAKQDKRTGAAKTNFFTLNERDLYDVTENLIQEGGENTVQAEVDELKEAYGWYLCFTEAGVCDDAATAGATPEEGAWIGEKGLASPVILDGKVYFTTYLPAASIETDPTDVCGLVVPEGESRLYVLDLLTGGAAYDFNKGNNDGVTGDLKAGDRHTSLRTGVVSDIAPINVDGKFRFVTNSTDTPRTIPTVDADIDPTFWMQE